MVKPRTMLLILEPDGDSVNQGSRNIVSPGRSIAQRSTLTEDRIHVWLRRTLSREQSSQEAQRYGSRTAMPACYNPGAKYRLLVRAVPREAMAHATRLDTRSIRGR